MELAQKYGINELITKIKALFNILSTNLETEHTFIIPSGKWPYIN